MHLMVLLRDIYLGRDTEGCMPFIYLSINYYFLSLLPWGLKYPPLGHQIHSLLHPWLIFSHRLVFFLSSNVLKGWKF